MALDETSQPLELLLSLRRDGDLTLGRQIEDRLRHSIRAQTLRPGVHLPSTRDLARQLGVSRRVVVDAYGQLAAEGYLSLRQGARPRVSAAAASLTSARHVEDDPPSPARLRFDLRPSMPDVSGFPRSAWLRSLREALATMSDDDLRYGDPRGVDALRTVLADYLGRVRGVVADPARVVVTTGYTQGLGVICRALRSAGVRRLALEDPSNPEDARIAAGAGLEVVRIGVDALGIVVDELVAADPDAVVVTPAHQHPTGVVLSGERRAALLAWLRDRGAIAIEDDYDAEYRYDRAAVGALQGLDPERVLYTGSASKTLAPALRLGWLVVPPGLLEAVTDEKLHADRGTARIEQQAFADFVARGELDRHLRRMRARYRGRRDALVRALGRVLPEARITGAAAGLHVTVEFPAATDPAAIQAQARLHGVEVETMSEFCHDPARRRPALVLGYGQLPEAAIPAAVGALADAVRAA